MFNNNIIPFGEIIDYYHNHNHNTLYCTPIKKITIKYVTEKNGNVQEATLSLKQRSLPGNLKA